MTREQLAAAVVIGGGLAFAVNACGEVVRGWATGLRSTPQHRRPVSWKDSRHATEGRVLRDDTRRGPSVSNAL